LEHSPYSDDENGEEGSSFSLSRPQLVAVDTNDATLIPTQPCIALDPTAQRALDRHASSEAAIRIRIASDFAYIQSLTPLSHAATAETNITGSSVPDIDILCDTLTLTDLVRIHTHAVLNLWAMFYIMACVTRECSPSQFNTSRLLSICADVPSIDRHIARRIQDRAAVPHTLSASAQSPTNPAAIALAYPFLASNTLAIVAECVTFDYDPITPLAHAIQNLHFHTNTNGLVFDGLSTLLAATDSIAKLPRHTIATLNLRENYKSIILLLVPLRQYDFRCTHRQTHMDWGAFIGTLLDEFRQHGTRAVSLESFRSLTTLLDIFDAASIDFANAFRTHSIPTPHSVSAVAQPTPTLSDEIALLRAELAALKKSASVAPNDPRPQASRGGRGRGPPPTPTPRPTIPSATNPYALVACTAAGCPKLHKAKNLACDCGAPSANLSACLECPANPLSNDVCNTCFMTFTPLNSRPAHPVLDKMQLARLRHHVTSHTMRAFFPHPIFTRNLNAPPAVQALSTAAPNAAPNAAADSFNDPIYPTEVSDWLLEYDESRPLSTHGTPIQCFKCNDPTAHMNTR